MNKNKKSKIILAKYKLKELIRERLNATPEQEAYQYLAKNFRILEECMIIDSRASMETIINGASYVPHTLQKEKILAIFHIIGVLYGAIDGRLKHTTQWLDFYYHLDDKMALCMTQDDIAELTNVKEQAPSKLFDLVEQAYDRSTWYDIITSQQFEELKKQIYRNEEEFFQKNAFLEGYLFGFNRTTCVNISNFIGEFDFLINKLRDMQANMRKDKMLVRELSNK